MTGTRQVHLVDLLVDGPRVHPLFPVRVVAVVDLQRDRTAERVPVTHAAGDAALSRSIFIRPPRP